MNNLILIILQSVHPRFNTNCFQLRAIKLISKPCQLLKVYITLQNIHLPCVNLHNFHSRIFIRKWKLYFSIQSTWTHQCGIQHIRSIRRSYHFDICWGWKSVQLIQQLKHSSLHFTISVLFRVKSFCSHCVYFINKNNSWRFLFSKLERIANNLRTISDEHLYELWSG